MAMMTPRLEDRVRDIQLSWTSGSDQLAAPPATTDRVTPGPID
jgi:hypothetical protein